MIKLTFTKFWQEVEKEKTHHVRIHRIEKAEEFIFFFMSECGWKYWTEISLQEIFNFANTEEVEYDAVLTDFYNTYCVNTLLVEEWSEYMKYEEEEMEMQEDPLVYTSSKSAELDAGEDIVDAADDYSDFFKSNVNLWKKKVLAKLDEVPVEKMYNPDYTKTFGEFVRSVLNVINSRKFMTVVRRFVKSGMKDGLEAAENEVGVDVGFTAAFEDKVLALENQQLNGYTINGKMWYGIKGATKEMQVRILRQVSEDVQNKVPRAKMGKNIEKIFDGVGKSQAERIARTETTRFINEGKLTTYKESGLQGRKAWAVVPVKCCDICDRLHNKYFAKGIEFDEPFVDDTTGKNYEYPPAHPHCRCVIEYRTNE